MDIQNTQVGHFPLTLTSTTAAGVTTTVPVPAGDVFTATSSSPSLGVAVANNAAGNQELVITPLVIESDAANAGGGIVVTVTDSNGDVAGELSGADAINIVTVPVVPVIRLGTPVFTTQPAPTAPGP
jgi:hypothetical protein